LNNEIIKDENAESESVPKQRLISIISQDVWGYAQVDCNTNIQRTNSHST